MLWFRFLQKFSRLPRSYALLAFRLNFDPENHKLFFIGSVVQFDHFKLLPEAQQLRLNPGILWGSLKILQNSPSRLPQKCFDIPFGPFWRHLSAILAHLSAILRLQVDVILVMTMSFDSFAEMVLAPHMPPNPRNLKHI